VAAPLDLLVIGDINADLIMWGTDPVPAFGQVEKLMEVGLLTIGGSSSITACGAARLGLQAACIGVLGNDALGSFMRTAMSRTGVDVSGCPIDATRQTGISVILGSSGRSDRAILTASGTVGVMSTAAISRDVLGTARHVHCGSYFLQPRLREGLADLFREARELGVTCSLDTNWDPSDTWDHGLASVLQQCDLFFPNEAEAIKITGSQDVDTAASALAQSGPTVVVKQGATGAFSRHGSRVLRARAPTVDYVDSTGAGDSFNAGYLLGFVRGWEPERCLALGVACGSLSTRALGGTEAQPTLEEALALASTIRVMVNGQA